MQRYEALPSLLLWRSFNNVSLAKGLSDFLIPNRGIQDNHESGNPLLRKLYYIDSVNSFPLTEFQKLVPLNSPTNKKTYDNIIINQALNVNELHDIVLHIIQSENLFKIQNEDKSDTEPQMSTDVLIIINGTDIMFQNSSMSDTTLAHDQLNSVLLQLRVNANRNNKTFKTIVLSRDPIQNQRSNSHAQKRVKQDGNSVSKYISKYYADYEL